MPLMKLNMHASPCDKIKGIVHPKIVIIYSPSCPSKTVWLAFICGIWKRIFWRMLVTKSFQFLFTYIIFFVHTKEVNGNPNCVVANILQKIFCSAEWRNAYRFRKIWGWVNYDRICGLWVDFNKVMRQQCLILHNA